jgi:hypothetical protein
MTRFIFDPKHWRERAKEARTQAEQMRNPDPRRTLLEIADNYEQLASQAERLRMAPNLEG